MRSTPSASPARNSTYLADGAGAQAIEQAAERNAVAQRLAEEEVGVVGHLDARLRCNPLGCCYAPAGRFEHAGLAGAEADPQRAATARHGPSTGALRRRLLASTGGGW